MFGFSSLARVKHGCRVQQDFWQEKSSCLLATPLKQGLFLCGYPALKAGDELWRRVVGWFVLLLQPRAWGTVGRERGAPARKPRARFRSG